MKRKYVFTIKYTHELCKININAENWQNDIKHKSFKKSKRTCLKTLLCTKSKRKNQTMFF